MAALESLQNRNYEPPLLHASSNCGWNGLKALRCSALGAEASSGTLPALFVMCVLFLAGSLADDRALWGDAPFWYSYWYYVTSYLDRISFWITNSSRILCNPSSETSSNLSICLIYALFLRQNLMYPRWLWPHYVAKGNLELRILLPLLPQS